MARRSNLEPLTLDESTTAPDTLQYVEGPKTPVTPKSPRSPRSPFRFTTKKPQLEDDQPPTHAADPPSRTALPASHTTPSLSTLQRQAAHAGEEKNDKGQPARSGFFGNYKASKSSSRLQSDSARPASEDNMSTDADRSVITRKVSSQEPTRSGTTHPVSAFSYHYHSLTIDCTIDPGRDRSTTRRPVGAPPRTDTPPAAAQPTDQPRAYASTSASASAALGKKNKPKPFNLLNRTRSIREDERSPHESSPNTRPIDPERIHVQHNLIKTAPLRSENDRSFRDMMSSNVRQHSADRQPATAREEPRSREPKDTSRTPTSFSTSFRDVGGHAFLTNLRNGATKGAGALSKGLFGKSSRSGSTNEKEVVVDDEHYQLKVINKPLVEQTRLTRISKRLENSRDKTEFWMPAFPWRAIDYLNYKGSDVEGLYRVPGSGPQIKKWQRRFDEGMSCSRQRRLGFANGC
jgi:hypothetical protein